MPVTFPPGRLKLATNPSRSGSLTAEKTIGMVEVAAFAASAAGDPPAANSTVTLSPTRSAASLGNRSKAPSAHRKAITTFCPSANPVSCNPCLNASTTLAEFVGRSTTEKSNHRRRSLLGPRHERPCRCRPAEQRYEFAPPHSITSSARPSNGKGTVRPSAFAVFRLMINSTFVACCTGRSAGFRL